MNKLLWVTLVILVFIPKIIFTQSKFPYQISAKKETIILGTSVGINAFGVWLTNKNKPLSLSQINALGRGGVYPAFDRRATYNWSPGASKVSYVFMFASMSAPLWLGASKTIRGNGHAKVVGVMAAETFLWTAGLTNIIKNTARRPRPFVYNPNAPLLPKLERDAKQSFFSGHTSISASMCFFTAQTFATIYPESRWKYAIWGTAAIVPAATGYYRIRAGKHFPTDIIAGYAVGALCGILVPYLHRAQ